MKNIQFPTGAGDDFTRVSLKAKELALKLRNNERNFTIQVPNVEFDFNGVKCILSYKTDPDLLYRDYCNAHRMEWETVGPDCVAQYSPEIQEELDKRTATAEKKYAEQRAQWDKEEKEKKAAFEAKVNGVEFECTDPEGLKANEEKNTDSYGARIIGYAKDWARLMQAGMAEGKKLEDIAEETSREADYDGITGFMYGAAVATLKGYWKYGEELRVWHNKQYGAEDSEGVVNPAVLTISVPENVEEQD